jgi:hypothetical protein
VVGVYFYVLKGNGLFEEDEEDALDEGAELLEGLVGGVRVIFGV